MQTDDLKSCPFCGSNKHMLLSPTCDRGTPYNPADRAFPIVRCGGCYTDVPGKDFDATGKSAVEAWNRRDDLAEEAQRPKEMKTLEAVRIQEAIDGLVETDTLLVHRGERLVGTALSGVRDAVRSALAVLRSALVDVPAIGFQVRNLEWETNGETWWVKGLAPRYEVGPTLPWGVTLHYGTRRIGHPKGDYFLSQDHAKASAQADFEQFVRSSVIGGDHG